MATPTAYLSHSHSTDVVLVSGAAIKVIPVMFPGAEAEMIPVFSLVSCAEVVVGSRVDIVVEVRLLIVSGLEVVFALVAEVLDEV